MNPAQLIGMAVGVWLMAAPATLGYVDRTAGDLHRTLGPLAATFALIAVWGVTRGVRLANIPIGAVLVVAAVIIPAPAVAVANGVLSGLAVALAAPFGGQPADPLGGGWRALTDPAPSRR